MISLRRLSALSLPAGLIACTLLLSACGGSPRVGQTDTSQAQLESRDPLPLIERAINSPSPEQEQYLLEAAEILANKQQADWARNLLSSIDSSQLASADYASYIQLYSRLALDDDAYFLAQRILTEPRLEQQWPTLSRQQQIELRERRAQTLLIIGEVDASVRERLLLEQLLDDTDDKKRNQESIWQALMSLPQAELKARLEREQDPELRGWYQLASINKNNQGDLGLQQRKIENWIGQWPDHPASQNLPSDLALIKELIRDNPQQVALLLPTSGKLGKAGRAIRDGFFSAYYQAYPAGSSAPTITLYDSANGDIKNLYQQALSAGAQAVIGPLDKAKLAELNELPELPVPVLSLNYLERSAQPHPSLYQFGLAVEDEAEQSAKRAWIEGHRRALVIAPDAGWGERSADAFIAKWHQLGGEVAGMYRYSGNGDYSRVVEHALQIDQSKKRAQLLKQMFGQNFEFEPRRRQDVDVIFMIARPNQARQLMPTLAFHYAANLPVFATSHIYSGDGNPKLDRDLNGIKFSTLPWMFSDSAEKKAVKRYSKPAASYERLYALGIDAFQLYPRLRQLQQVPGTRFYGNTGALQLTPEQRIYREQSWAQIRAGIAQPLPAVVKETL